MDRFSLSHLSDQELIESFEASLGELQASTARMLECIAQVDALGVFRDAGYETLEEFCLAESGIDSEEVVAFVQVARASREFPGILQAIEQGHHEVTTLSLVVPYLTSERAAELLVTTKHMSARRLRNFLRERFGAAPGAATD